jgi:integrase
MYWIFFKVLIETGMRKGEAAALQWGDIGFKEKTIRINKNLDFQPGEDDEIFGDTKNRKTRVIDMADITVCALKTHLTLQNQNKLMLNDFYRHDLNLVFSRKDGEPMPKSTLFNAFERILKRAGLNPYPIHSLRHTYVVLLLEAGTDIKYIQKLLGHGSYQITADVYAHVSKKMNKKNTEQVNLRLNDVFK